MMMMMVTTMMMLSRSPSVLEQPLQQVNIFSILASSLSSGMETKCDVSLQRFGLTYVSSGQYFYSFLSLEEDNMCVNV